MIDPSRVIIALDFSKKEDALRIVKTLEGFVDFYKVGVELFISEGPDIIKELKKLGKRVFLDLKLHDIPNTVYKACRSAISYNVDMLTVHASGGFTMMRKAVDALKEYSINEGVTTKLLAVTALTSLDEEDLMNIGITLKISEFVKRVAQMAKNAGFDGAVSSAKEIRLIKEHCGKDFLVVTPGIRFVQNKIDDQKRVVTAKEAFMLGADYIVVGRAIVSSENPIQAFKKLFTGS